MHDQRISRELHTWVLDRLSEYIDDRLSPLERVQIERHLQTCAKCQRELDTLRWTLSLILHTPKPTLPRQFTLPVAPAPARAPLFGLSALRLATAVATLVLVSLLGIDFITSIGGSGASAPLAQMRASEATGPTMAAFAVGSPTEPQKDTMSNAGQPAPQLSVPTPTSIPTPAPLPTAAPRAPSAPPAATAAPAAIPTGTATDVAPKGFSLSPYGTRNGVVTESPPPLTTATGLGAGPVQTLPSNKSSDSAQVTPAPTETLQEALAGAAELSPTNAPSPTATTQLPTIGPPTATSTLRVEAKVVPTSAPSGPPVVPPLPGTAGQPSGISPLRVAEFVVLFVTVFLGSLLLLLRFRK